jgi:septal ring factor EnvC (AmiA/AmiB activator)
MDTSLIIAIIGAVSTIAGFFAGRRKRQVEIVGKELDNIQKAIQVWKDVTEYQTDEIVKLREEIDNLKKELSKVEKMYREIKNPKKTDKNRITNH